MTHNGIVEDRRIYEISGSYWMVLTAGEFLQWQAEAPHLIRYVHGEPCSEVIHHRKVKES